MVRLNGRDGITIAIIALLVTVEITAADPVGGDVDRSKVLVQQHVVRLAGLGPTLTLLDHVFKDPLPKVLSQSDL